MKLIIIGPPGSGKGVQSELISKKCGIPHISVGQMYREEISKESETGKKVKRMVERGELAPDKVTINLLERRLGRKDAKNGYVIDGFPRTLAQAKGIEESIEVIYLRVSDEVVVERLSHRFQCERCGKIEVSPGKCRKCRTVLVRRTDDEEETVRARLKIFHRSIRPILDHYARKNILHEVDGDQTVEKVHEDIMAVIGSLENSDE